MWNREIFYRKHSGHYYVYFMEKARGVFPSLKKTNQKGEEEKIVDNKRAKGNRREGNEEWGGGWRSGKANAVGEVGEVV